MKRNILVFLLLVCALPVLILGNIALNNLRLWSLVRQFERISHPPNTVQLQYVTFIGNVSGTHDQCDYFIGQLRSFPGDEKSVRKSYKNSKVTAVNRQAKPVEIAFYKNFYYDDSSFAWINDVNQWFSPQNMTGNKFYVVYLWDGGYSPGLDGRCH